MPIGRLTSSRVKHVEADEAWEDIIVDKVDHRRRATLLARRRRRVCGAEADDSGLDGQRCSTDQDARGGRGQGSIESPVLPDTDEHAVHPTPVAQLNADGRIPCCWMNARDALKPELPTHLEASVGADLEGPQRLRPIVQGSTAVIKDFEREDLEVVFDIVALDPHGLHHRPGSQSVGVRGRGPPRQLRNVVKGP